MTAQITPIASASSAGTGAAVLVMGVLLVVGVVVAITVRRRWPSAAGLALVVSVVMGLGLLAVTGLPA